MLPPAALLVATLLLAGCVPSQPIVTPAPEPSSTPIFASDEDALAAATEAYAKYLEAADQSLSTFSTEELGKHAEGKALAAATAKSEEYEVAGKHQIGRTNVSSSTPADLESVLRSNEDLSQVQIYGCVNLSAVDIQDAGGNSIVAPDRPGEVLYLVSLVWHSTEEVFMITDQEHWANGC